MRYTVAGFIENSGLFGLPMAVRSAGDQMMAILPRRRSGGVARGLHRVTWYICLATAISVSACASPKKQAYDINAKETPVRLLTRQFFDYDERKTSSDNYYQFHSFCKGKKCFNFSTDTLDDWKKVKIPIYEYTVVDSTNIATTVLSEFAGFELGQCLKLLTSNQPTYPRLAFGATCEKFQNEASPENK